MSRTHKTKPFRVKLRQGHLKTEEWHDHTDGVCDLSDDEEKWGYGRGCRHGFVYTGTHVCCCPMCHGDFSWDVPPGKRQRIESREAERNWGLEY